MHQRRSEQNADDASTISELVPATHEHSVVRRHHEVILCVPVARLQQRGQRGRRGSTGQQNAHPKWQHANGRSRRPQTPSASESASCPIRPRSHVSSCKHEKRESAARGSDADGFGVPQVTSVVLGAVVVGVVRAGLHQDDSTTRTPLRVSPMGRSVWKTEEESLRRTPPGQGRSKTADEPGSGQLAVCRPRSCLLRHTPNQRAVGRNEGEGLAQRRSLVKGAKKHTAAGSEKCAWRSPQCPVLVRPPGQHPPTPPTHASPQRPCVRRRHRHTKKWAHTHQSATRERAAPASAARVCQRRVPNLLWHTLVVHRVLVAWGKGGGGRVAAERVPCACACARRSCEVRGVDGVGGRANPKRPEPVSAPAPRGWVESGAARFRAAGWASRFDGANALGPAPPRGVLLERSSWQNIAGQAAPCKGTLWRRRLRVAGLWRSRFRFSFGDKSLSKARNVINRESPALSAGLGAKLCETVFILNDIWGKPNEDTQEST